MAKYINADKLIENCEFFETEMEVKNAPAEDVAPIVRGKWINRGDMNDGECSVCKKLIRATDSANFKYCPNCGAKMKKSEEE